MSNWLKFYYCDPPLTCLSTFVSHDPVSCVELSAHCHAASSYTQGLDLRVEHTHCFSDHGQGGHYHFDSTPDDVLYEGYFVVAEQLYRIDKPE